METETVGTVKQSTIMYLLWWFGCVYLVLKIKFGLKFNFTLKVEINQPPKQQGS